MVILGMSRVLAATNLKSGTLIGLGPLHAASDQRDRLAAARADGAGLGAALGVLAANGVDAEIAELAVEEAVIGAAAEFAVGRRLEPDALLQRQRLLARALLRGVDRP